MSLAACRRRFSLVQLVRQAYPDPTTKSIISYFKELKMQYENTLNIY